MSATRDRYRPARTIRSAPAPSSTQAGRVYQTCPVTTMSSPVTAPMVANDHRAWVRARNSMMTEPLTGMPRTNPPNMAIGLRMPIIPPIVVTTK